MRFFKELWHWLKRTPRSELLLPQLPALTQPPVKVEFVEMTQEHLQTIISQLSGMEMTPIFEETPPPTLSLTSVEAIAPPADPFNGRPQTTMQVMGAAAPIDQPQTDSLTREESIALNKISKELYKQLLEVQNEFLSHYKSLKYTEKNYVVLDAAAALAAAWSCSDESAKNSTLNVPSMMMSTVELFQHNFMEKQKELHQRFGRLVH